MLTMSHLCKDQQTLLDLLLAKYRDPEGVTRHTIMGRKLLQFPSSFPNLSTSPAVTRFFFMTILLKVRINLFLALDYTFFAMPVYCKQILGVNRSEDEKG